MATGSSQTGTEAHAIPQRKISETIIDFGAPLILDLDPHQPIEIVRAVFTIVIQVWNAHVMAMPVWGKPQLLEELKKLLRSPGTAPQLIDTYNDLSTRRRQHFRADPRAVGEWNVQFDQARRIRLHCEAHVPPSLMPPRQ